MCPRYCVEVIKIPASSEIPPADALAYAAQADNVG
jgi:hypothetical protein